MRQIALAVVCLLWGGAIVVLSLVEGIPSPTAGAYAAGQFGGYVFGGLLVLAGAHGLLNGRR